MITKQDVEFALHSEVYYHSRMAAEHHDRLEQIVGGPAFHGASSVGSFRYNSNERSYHAEKARKALFQLIGDGETFDDYS